MNRFLPTPPSNYKEAIDFLYSQLPMFQRVGPKAFKTDLNNIRELASILGNPERHTKFVHVAGTNGKGSVSHILAGILQASGYKTGLYTSPHYRDFRERIKVNGQPVNESFVTDFVNRVAKLSLELQPSFFEITVAMAFDFFRSEKVDVAIIETGLGGRLDSTNIIHPVLSIITNIGLDHTQFLGNNLPAIAIEKAGIIKPEVAVVIGKTQPETREVFSVKAAENKAPILYADQIYKTTLARISLTHSRVTFSQSGRSLLNNLNVNLIGKYQEENLNTALASALLLNEYGFEIKAKNIAFALQNLREITGFMGRMQVLGKKPLTIADSAHNIDGMKMLMKEIGDFSFEKLHIVIGLVSDKDSSGLLAELPANATYYFAKANIPRGMNAIDLKQKASTYGLRGEVCKSVHEALSKARKSAEVNDLILVCGSIFTVAEVVPH